MNRKKVKKRVVSFNLFDAEDDMSKEPSYENEAGNPADDEYEGTQISLFQDEAFDNGTWEVTKVAPAQSSAPAAVTDGPVEESVAIEEEPEVVAEEPVAVEEEPEVIVEEPVAVEEEPEVIVEEPVAVEEEPVEAAEDDHEPWDPVQTEQVDLMAAKLESDVLDEEEFTYPVRDNIQQEAPSGDGTPAMRMEDLPSFRDIQRADTSGRFETPYRYECASGDRVRYRLSLPGKTDVKKVRTVRQILSFTLTVILALVLALLLRAFVFLFATVEGPSMQPTLVNGERVLVTRYTYAFSPIERGDVIVCRFDHPNYPDFYVKRVIALGGDTVRITEGVVYVNGEAVEEDYTLAPAAVDFPETRVPEDSVFVLGDNRNNSTDSRKVGAIRKNLIVGKARCILYPFSQFGKGLDSEK